jgi:hypothetical protein
LPERAAWRSVSRPQDPLDPATTGNAPRAALGTNTPRNGCPAGPADSGPRCARPAPDRHLQVPPEADRVPPPGQPSSASPWRARAGLALSFPARRGTPPLPQDSLQGRHGIRVIKRSIPGTVGMQLAFIHKERTAKEGSDGGQS